ncbi:hypothetical protein A3K34_02210 [candidate division WWE3 bacterium RIFOXYC1_FULL_40_10]|uniref:Uncharacterized protein n=1 Tax=candidate division WWE3 bacterium RIFOXYA2_FULL_46_9 TaxID=1802636 RepID=A0A1F4W2L7_UNCKA|nr:MAG: hypothetical protein A3K58_02210 [candidate division WWE3 bacterium RIFOXYB1_FULL_40_22]OGC61667.1 MAG: hypothetical protein A3K37_02210 [candidate division WWE3 bacterium RIFOXYA1_FULL_40_11]OGC63293.1 MAG: hypothetical protein A2264_02835 [candidate division WWE3 bacterium RIFOXYA2_FULL_46_9]OGC64843.1 MAG: hypothetical protein A2326_01040 [candidate division WWE3 bacterium RIFOXYB2_FULL_41_6]OGC66050.1 MAG: hypothetical protein A3K34_02210 [candidate division WWE3 bacterium RIFOXYC1_
MLVNRCLDIIKLLPVTIPLDTNPGSFVLNPCNDIVFVDFTPVNPWRYNDTRQQKNHEALFPSIVNEYSDKHTKYFTPEGRIARFLYHLKNLI